MSWWRNRLTRWLHLKRPGIDSHRRPYFSIYFSFFKFCCSAVSFLFILYYLSTMKLEREGGGVMLDAFNKKIMRIYFILGCFICKKCCKCLWNYFDYFFFVLHSLFLKRINTSIIYLVLFLKLFFKKKIRKSHKIGWKFEFWLK